MRTRKSGNEHEISTCREFDRLAASRAESYNIWFAEPQLLLPPLNMHFRKVAASAVHLSQLICLCDGFNLSPLSHSTHSTLRKYGSCDRQLHANICRPKGDTCGLYRTHETGSKTVYCTSTNAHRANLCTSIQLSSSFREGITIPTNTRYQ